MATTAFDEGTPGAANGAPAFSAAEASEEIGSSANADGGGGDLPTATTATAVGENERATTAAALGAGAPSAAPPSTSGKQVQGDGAAAAALAEIGEGAAVEAREDKKVSDKLAIADDAESAARTPQDRVLFADASASTVASVAHGGIAPEGLGEGATAETASAAVVESLGRGTVAEA